MKKYNLYRFEDGQAVLVNDEPLGYYVVNDLMIRENISSAGLNRYRIEEVKAVTEEDNGEYMYDADDCW